MGPFIPTKNVCYDYSCTLLALTVLPADVGHSSQTWYDGHLGRYLSFKFPFHGTARHFHRALGQYCPSAVNDTRTMHDCRTVCRDACTTVIQPVLTQIQPAADVSILQAPITPRWARRAAHCFHDAPRALDVRVQFSLTKVIPTEARDDQQGRPLLRLP